MCLGAMTPKSVKMREQSTVGQLNYSPPTDMETDVSALMEDVITNSSLLNSDVSFETSDVSILLIFESVLSIYLSICLSVCLSVCLSIYLSIYLAMELILRTFKITDQRKVLSSL